VHCMSHVYVQLYLWYAIETWKFGDGPTRAKIGEKKVAVSLSLVAVDPMHDLHISIYIYKL